MRLIHIGFWVTNILYKTLPLIALFKYVLRMSLREVNVLDRRARRKIVTEFPRLGLGSKNLQGMVDVKAHFQLCMEYDLILSRQPFLNTFTGTRIPCIRPPNVFRLIHKTRPVTVDCVEKFLAFSQGSIGTISDLTIKRTGPIVSFITCLFVAWKVFGGVFPTDFMNAIEIIVLVSAVAVVSSRNVFYLDFTAFAVFFPTSFDALIFENLIPTPVVLCILETLIAYYDYTIVMHGKHVGTTVELESPYRFCYLID